jgi:hypothetical protein
MPYGTVNADLMTTSDGVSSSGLYGFKNRIINGAMVIDQRNAGAYSVAINTYTVDRWGYQATQSNKGTWGQNFSGATPPAGFASYLGFQTGGSAFSVGAGDYFSFYQPIEGFNTADFAWGTANAKTVTLSFQVLSSLTGTFGGVLQNSASSRCYPFTYTVSSANTWTQISITIAGETTGTWLTTNGVGVRVLFNLGCGSTYSGAAGAWSSNNYVAPTGTVSVVGTASATFYITGVQLEKGSTATSFDYRPYGTELALCQRYYAKTFPQTIAPANGLGLNYFLGYSPNSTNPSTIWKFPVTMRSAPTLTLFNDRVGGTAGQWNAGTIDGAYGRALGSSTEFVMFDNTAVPVAASNWWLGGATASSEL